MILLTHIRVRISERRLDPDRFLVMHQRLVELALLLQHRCQIAVSSSEFWKHFQSLQIEPRRFFDVTLLAFNVSQIVQGISVGRAQS